MNSINLRYDNHPSSYLKMIGLAMLMVVISYLTVVAFQVWSTPTVAPAMPAKKAVVSLADHLAFTFGMSEVGFPDPPKRHDMNKQNSLRKNGEHIRNALKGIEKHLERNQTLREFFLKRLKEDQYRPLIEALDNLALDLQNQGYFYEQFGASVSDEILEILIRTGYIVP
jgi:hypothetical protein